MSGKRYPYEEYHKEIDGLLHKKCTLHEQYFPNETEWFPATPEYFHPNSNNGFHTYCRRCNNEKTRQWRMEHHERYKQYMKDYNSRPDAKLDKSISDKKRRGKVKEWRETHPDKMKEYRLRREGHKKHNISKSEWMACKQYFDNMCAYCGLSIEQHWIKFKEVFKLGDFHKDHYINDGANDLRNCIPACKSCNTQKKKHSFDDWYNLNNPFYCEDRYNKVLQWIEGDYKQYIKERG